MLATMLRPLLRFMQCQTEFFRELSNEGWLCILQCAEPHMHASRPTTLLRSQHWARISSTMSTQASEVHDEQRIERSPAAPGSG